MIPQTVRYACLAAAVAVAGFGAAGMPAAAEGVIDGLLTRMGLRSHDDGIAASNGRIEAQSVDVAAKYAGRLTQVLVAEGQTVAPGDVIARIDDRDVQAKLLAAQAAVLQAKAAKEQAQAAVMQAQSALSVAQTSHDRTAKLNAEGHAAQSVLDDATNALQGAKASLASAQAQVSNGDALIAAAQAQEEEVKVALEDLTVTAPIRGRVQYRLHEPGEVLAAGTPIVTLLDLSDVYMNLYLPADVVGMLAADDAARLILDPVPQFVIPATVTFISPQAQFTPKSVETQEERAQLVFRVKLRIPPELLEKFEKYVKVGVRGMGYVRRNPAAEWPAHLAVKLPQ
ncbi:HlyD family secretion protein [Paenirhodobacter sp.]|uniref:HlyD family secretion protein n=1 Tax=Paenirhodobacter sp. TaxID=1965326 RepID=UPI003B501C9B